MRRIAWFSCGAASAVAAAISEPDVIAYCDTGSEDEDNDRFRRDCEAQLFDRPVTVLTNPEYVDTWDVWEKHKYLAGIRGARCTGALKIVPRVEFQQVGDLHIFGYTNDASDISRANRLRESFPDLDVKFPLIENGLSKVNCLSMIEAKGLALPRVYAIGFPNANCIPCVKATSANYWALVRQEFPDEFERMSELSRRLNVRLCRINGERAFIDEIPLNHPVTDALVPSCDLLCQTL